MTLTDELGVWKEYKATFTPSQDCNWAHITIFNTTNTTVAGNDFVLDGLYFGAEKKTGSSTEKEDFNVTVYDTFEYDFQTVEVCPGEKATITTTLVPAHGGTLEPSANYKYEWKLNGTTPVVSTNKDLQVTAPNTVASESYVISTSSTVCYNSGAKSQTTSVKTKDCGKTETIDHPAVTVCTNQNVTLTCNKTGSSVKWSHDASLADTEITVTSSSTVGDANSYTCTITATENGSTVTYIENFTVKSKECSILYESTMCNTSVDSTLTTQKKGDKYIWTLPDGNIKEAVLDNIKISHIDANVGDKFAYSCEIWKNASAPVPSAPTLANNIIENGGFEDVTLVGGEYKGFTSDYEFHTVDQGFNYSKSNRGFMQVSSKESYGIKPASGNYMYECDGDDKVNKNRAWIASTDKNPRLKITKGTQYQFSYKAAMQGTTNNPKLTFYIEFNGKKEKLLDTQTLPADSKWHTYGEGTYWTAPEDCNDVTLSLVDDCFKNAGNDFCLDDIMFQPLQSGSSPGSQPTLIATENFEVTITDCHKETGDEEEVQVKEDGSITLYVPEEYRCENCRYIWYKKDENGQKGEPVVKNIGEEDWEHTVHNAKEEDYVCEIIEPNGNKHEQSYKVRVYVPKTSKYCYTKDSENEQYVTIDDLTVADRDEYEWYLIQGNDTIPMPEAAIVSTENQKITLDVDYFVNNNSKFPVTVHILEEFAHKLQVESTEIEGGNNSTDVTPEPEPTPETPIAPAPAPVAPAAIPPIQINTSALSISSLNIINGGKSYSYEHTFEDASTSTVNIEIGQDYQYTEYFAPKVGGMTEHAGVVRLTNTGINGCHAYKGDDPNNEYFFEVDGGDKAGPIFSIVQEGKIIKGKKYILRFLARETSTDPSISGPTTNPAKIDFQITLNGNTYGVTNQIVINKQDWTAHVFNYIANEDADNVILTLSNYNTDSGHNDFAIDEITFALADPSIAPENRSLKFRNLADENEGIVDEDGDGFVMWKDEHILSIYPNSSQTLVEVSSPNKEHETEVKLPNGEKVKFTYYPSMYQESMTQYTESATREDEHGCKHTVNFTLNLVELEPDLYFSPNDDGVHDKWMVKGIETAPSAHIMIYDRHSKLLYKCLGSEFQGWDGNYNGHGMVQDDYWYVIQIPETGETLSGHFTLKR